MLIDLPTVECENPPDFAAPLPVSVGDFRLGHYRLSAGPRTGCELIVADSGRAIVAICPTRGMSLWKARLGGVDCQWNSPVSGPIHPSFVALDDPGGIGWLDGFDELLVRCGLRSFGAPDFDARGKLLFPLHGRIGNLPAENVRVRLDQQHSELVISGQVCETRFLVYNLRLHVEYRLPLNQPTIAVKDQVTNAGGSPTSMQLLYHINFGQPILSAGSRLHLAAPQIVPRDGRAEEDMSSWATYLPPTAGYSEQVYFSQPVADAAGWARVLLSSADDCNGVAVHYRTDTLPYFTQWKNTALDADGYVTGLEPGTGFPNPRSFEEQHGRIVLLQPGDTRQFELKIVGVSQPEQAQEMIKQVRTLQGNSPPELLRRNPDWCLPR